MLQHTFKASEIIPEILCCLCEVLIGSLQRRCPVGLAICSFPAGPDIQVTKGTHPVDILANQGTNLIRHHLFELRCRVGGFKGSIPPQNQVGSSISTRELGKQPNWHFNQRASALPYRVTQTQPSSLWFSNQEHPTSIRESDPLLIAANVDPPGLASALQLKPRDWGSPPCSAEERKWKKVWYFCPLFLYQISHSLKLVYGGLFFF